VFVFQITGKDDSSVWVQYFMPKRKNLWLLADTRYSVDTKDICSVLDPPDIVLTAGSRFLYQFNKI